MKNEDLKRFYEDTSNLSEPFDFVRLDKDGKLPVSVIPESALLYHHDIKFKHSEDSQITYSISFMSNSADRIESESALLAAIYERYGITSIVGATNSYGLGEYANPLGCFQMHCGSTGSNFHIYTPVWIDYAVIIDGVEYTLSKVKVLHIGNATLTQIIDTVTSMIKET